MAEQNNPEKKIIVDEDWKTQVEAEREAARDQATTEPEQPESAGADDEGQPLPPADLTFLATSLYLQAMVSLGLLPNPAGGEARVSLSQARHAIDTLDVLRQKTEGNRTDDESRAIDAMLHESRMACLAVQQGGAAVGGGSEGSTGGEPPQAPPA